MQVMYHLCSEKAIPSKQKVPSIADYVQ